MSASGETTRVYVLVGQVPGLPGAAGLIVAGERFDGVIEAADAIPPGARVLDFRPHTLFMGTIDVHTHGAVGCSFSSGPDDDTLAILRYRASTGCTGLLATITGQWDELLAALRKLGRLSGGTSDGAALLGIHVEGPFLNPVRKGAIDERTMRPPSIDDLRRMQDAAAGWIKMMTVAPELPGALATIEEMVRLGIVASIGHSDATYEQVLDAASAGAQKSTHTFNAMRPLHHRDPGTVGGVLADHRLTAELIPDGVHVQPGAMRVLINAKSPENVVLVTDGVRYAGLPEGVYERPGRGRTIIKGGVALADDGTIAGSVAPMNRNLRLLQRSLNLGTLPFHMATKPAARLLGLWRKRQPTPGMDADFAVYDDDLNCRATFVGGRQVYVAD